MGKLKIVKEEGLTFDDLLLIPAYSDVLPNEVKINTRLTKDIEINIPLVSAAMDTVTTAPLAIALAKEGGVGFIHKNMSIERQAGEVRLVKRHESNFVVDPITLGLSVTVEEAVALMKEKKIGGIPVVDENKVLLGLVTNRDLRFERDQNKTLEMVMVPVSKLVVAPPGISFQEATRLLEVNKIKKLPIVNEAGVLTGLVTFRDTQLYKEYPNACKDGAGRLRVGAAIGITPDFMERTQALVNEGVDVVVLDSAHGHSKGIIKTLKAIKKAFPGLQVIAGNVATGNGAKALADAGADAVKVGVGPGSICTTRIISGAGVPQVTAIMEVSRALAETGIPVIADGGIRYTGDVVKAIGVGAWCVMMGSAFAGTEESPGEIIYIEGRKFKVYRGMGSVEAMVDGSKDRYFQSGETNSKKLVPEGISGRVPYKGTVTEVVLQYVGGLRAGMGYAGVHDISELQKNSQFRRITSASMTESHPHDVFITNQAPNYGG